MTTDSFLVIPGICKNLFRCHQILPILCCLVFIFCAILYEQYCISYFNRDLSMSMLIVSAIAKFTVREPCRYYNAMICRARLCHSMSSAVRPYVRQTLRLSVCLSVCLSVTFRFRDHIGWNTSKIISD